MRIKRKYLILFCANRSVLAFFLAYLFVFLFSPEAFSSQSVNDANNLVTMEDYLVFSERNNASLKSSFEQWNAAAEQIAQAKAFPDPQLSFGYAIRPTPQRSMFEVMQMFPWFGTIGARTDAATARSQSARQQYNSQQLELFYNVKQGFYEYCYLAKAVQISKENVELAKHIEEIVRTRYSLSSVAHPDIIRSQIELAKFENELISLEKLRPAIVARLNSLLTGLQRVILPGPKNQIIKNFQWIPMMFMPL